MSHPYRGSAMERAGLAAIAAQLLTEAAGATVRARSLLALADLAGAGAVPAGLSRALADLADCRVVVDSRLDALQAAINSNLHESAAAQAAAAAALESLQRRGEVAGG